MSKGYKPADPYSDDFPIVPLAILSFCAVAVLTILVVALVSTDAGKKATPECLHYETKRVYQFMPHAQAVLNGGVGNYAWMHKRVCTHYKEQTRAYNSQQKSSSN
jgi:hypothetical protein